MTEAQRQEIGATPAQVAATLMATQPPRLSVRNRYSIFVGWMKVVLPALAVALVLMVVVWPQLMLYDDRFRIRVSDISLEQADTLTMLNARYEGLDDENQPFYLTADQAVQSSENKNLIDLEMPKGDITLNSGTWLVMEAQEGLFNRDSQLLDLAGDVTLFHDEGFELRTQSARIDLEAGTAEGNETTKGQGPSGTSQSEGFQVLERGDVVIFTGKSRLTIYTEDEAATPAAGEAGPGEARSGEARSGEAGPGEAGQ